MNGNPPRRRMQAPSAFPARAGTRASAGFTGGDRRPRPAGRPPTLGGSARTSPDPCRPPDPPPTPRPTPWPPARSSACSSAQFLAAFNDQAIHAAAMFFAINTQTLSEAQAISLMPILFYAPWAIFCTLAGYLADRYSKRTHARLLEGRRGRHQRARPARASGSGPTAGTPHAGAWVVLATVFLMGTHSAFFVPAKYGVMPEILQPHLLSRGNGCSNRCRSWPSSSGTVSGGVLSFVFLGREANIGIILLVLAVVGALASLLIRRMPAANPTRPFPPYLYGPLLAQPEDAALRRGRWRSRSSASPSSRSSSRSCGRRCTCSARARTRGGTS